jgi:hypothetical protein
LFSCTFNTDISACTALRFQHPGYWKLFRCSGQKTSDGGLSGAILVPNYPPPHHHISCRHPRRILEDKLGLCHSSSTYWAELNRMHRSPSPSDGISQLPPVRDAVIPESLDAGNTPDSSSNVEKFDLVIKGTGLTESILAAAASWAGKKVLHVENNTFYGSHWAALSLDQIDNWALENASQGFTYKDKRLTGIDGIPYNSAKLTRLQTSTLSNPSPLQTSRSYSLDLAPHLLYCSSDLVSCLANTKLSEYLEFKALEHIFILQKDRNDQTTLQKVPSSREDIFTSSLSLHDKRRLMKFLTYLLSIENAGKSP